MQLEYHLSKGTLFYAESRCDSFYINEIHVNGKINLSRSSDNARGIGSIGSGREMEKEIGKTRNV